MPAPIISVITPVYNCEEDVQPFINNFNQASDGLSTELLLIDDGSNDRTLDLIQQAAKMQDNIQALAQHHLFQSAARNKGMAQARGKYFLFLDIDDRFSTKLFNKMISKIAGNDLVICGINRVLKNNTLNMSKSVLEGTNSKDEIAKRFLINRDQMDSGLWNKIFKASIIKNNGLQFSNKNFVEDILFLFNYLMCINPHKIAFIHEPLYTYYQNSGTTTTIYYPELDQLAKSYVSQVDACLNQHHIANRVELVANTFARTEIYVLHRHILGDPAWNTTKQKEFLSHLTDELKNSSQLLPIKYRLGLIAMKLVPYLYIITYRAYKHVH
jgi:glycosyltransferase involved in cell wall biosynthesis